MEFVDRLRQAAFALGALTSFGIAEQHHDPAPVIAGIPGATWPTSTWGLWVIWFILGGLLCLVALWAWPDHMAWPRLAAIVVGSGFFARGTSIFIEYRWDLWGTAVHGWFMAVIVVGSWAWSGSTMRAVSRAGQELGR